VSVHLETDYVQTYAVCSRYCKQHRPIRNLFRDVLTTDTRQYNIFYKLIFYVCLTKLVNDIYSRVP